jgi:hypothetical protein
MLRRLTLSLSLALALGSCSYGYDVLAVVRGGRLVFIVDPASPSHPSCVRRIEVTAEGSAQETVWQANVGYDDDCANTFPLAHGAPIKGRLQPEDPFIPAKPLRRGVIYDLSTTSGATGYGGGRFVVREDGRIRNLPAHEVAPARNAASSGS